MRRSLHLQGWDVPALLAKLAPCPCTGNWPCELTAGVAKGMEEAVQGRIHI